ncbi:MAG: carboxypeptidase-like regulatory domain-containing protein [Bacteroidota bacterium]
MRSMWKSISAVVLVALFLSCKSDAPTGPGANSAVMSGQVTQAGAGTAIAGATVALVYQGQGFSAATDATGNYSITIGLADTLPATVPVTISAGGYQTATQNAILTPNQTTTANFQLSLNTTPVPPPPPGGGYANTIAFVGVTTTDLAVYGVGGTESAVVTFEARDSLGSPILPARADTITFSISGVPVGGGAYITPTSGLTNTAARVSTVIQSGSVAGAIQVEASLRRDTDGLIVRSTPVRLLIHGGLPDQTHFSVGANPINVPLGWIKFGQTSTITALVGDRYGNPVRPGTAVYFGNPTQGVVTTLTGYTDLSGFASGILQSGNPYAANGRGFAYAETIGENGVRVRDSVAVIFTGEPIISNLTAVGPFVVDNTTSVTVTFTVADINGNPMPAGTGISATVEGTGSAVVSKVSPTGTLGDVISTFWTNFSVTVSKNLQASPATPGPITLTITAAGSGIEASASIQGTVN